MLFSKKCTGSLRGEDGFRRAEKNPETKGWEVSAAACEIQGKQRLRTLFLMKEKTERDRNFLKLENDYDICRKMLGKRTGMLENTGI